MENYSKVLIIDYGAPGTQLLARRVREAGVYSEILPCTASKERIAAAAPSAIILSGAPEASAPAECGDRPVFLCRTGCAAAEGDGCEPGAAPPGEATSPTASGPTGSRPRASSQGSGDRPIFHVTSECDAESLGNFLFTTAKLTPGWTMASFAERCVRECREKIGDGEVVLALSGGVDSTVVAALLHRAVGERLHCIFVDHGLMRHNEAEEVAAMFTKNMPGLNLRHLREADLFLGRLKGVEDPEQKRKIIGRTFIEVFEREAKKLPGVRFLGQGTIYPDVVESCSAKGVVIKSHHNVGGLPEEMRLELVEPLRELFKDEVRALGTELGLPEDLVWRQPFPGPGLAVRVLGEVSEERLAILRAADHIVQQELRAAGWQRKVWQGFAVLLPLCTVGMRGDARSYENVVALRVVDSVDAMTATWTRLPHEILAAVSGRIVNEVAGVNRVVFDISSKPPSTIEWE